VQDRVKPSGMAIAGRLPLLLRILVMVAALTATTGAEDGAATVDVASEIAEDDVGGMARYIIESSDAAPGTDCSSGAGASSEEGELCRFRSLHARRASAGHSLRTPSGLDSG
jgi:hypothetical protein